MKYLLPHRFKKIGSILAPAGFTLWICMQFGFVTKLLVYLFGESATPGGSSAYLVVNACIAILSFFSFLAGIYFVTFSREKIEDEMVQRTRLDSFQFAALAQIVFMIASFVLMLLFDAPGDGGLMLFFITTIFVFWLCFIGRFNYIMHVSIVRLSKA